MSSPLESRVKEALRQQLATRNGSVDTPSPLPEPKEETPPPPVKLGANQVLFSKLVPCTLGTLKKMKLRDFAVTVLDTTTIPKEIAAFVPTIDPDYNVQVAEAHALLMSWEFGERVLITGPTGSGKSSLIEWAAAATKRPFIRINMTDDIDSMTLFGSLTVENGGTLWKDGPVTEAVKYGAVCLIDEWDVTPPPILFGMQWLFEENGKLFLKEMPGTSADKFLIPHTNFRLVCAGNTVGQGDDTGRYSGTNVQNNASIDRFQTTIVLDYLDREHEIAIIQKRVPTLDKDLPLKMVSFAQLVRTAAQQNNINLTMSPRTLINWAKKIVAYDSVPHALNLAFGNKLRESDRKVVGEHFQKVFGLKL